MGKAKKKSPSQRLRNVLFRYWEQQPKKRKTMKEFNTFYESWMNSKIEEIKKHLN